jgi:hypothetical protein
LAGLPEQRQRTLLVFGRFLKVAPLGLESADVAEACRLGVGPAGPIGQFVGHGVVLDRVLETTVGVEGVAEVEPGGGLGTDVAGVSGRRERGVGGRQPVR